MNHRELIALNLYAGKRMTPEALQETTYIESTLIGGLTSDHYERRRRGPHSAEIAESINAMHALRYVRTTNEPTERDRYELTERGSRYAGLQRAAHESDHRRIADIVGTCKGRTKETTNACRTHQLMRGRGGERYATMIMRDSGTGERETDDTIRLMRKLGML